eukprot:TRINITY_DN5890_c0_g1_i1.p1 TRINITY_DN5890_c0_g1~~TRINITY_DN5890_c0_g1_i1.p1  ORF type:complete len:201 (+),score=41.87 TRINITY_DN5890_c0_g1_i1:94-696(+)
MGAGGAMASEVQANVVERFSVPREGRVVEDEKWEVKNLPVEVVLQIFTKLSLRDLSSVILVSKLWRNIGQDARLWKRFALKVKGDNPSILRSIMVKPRFALMDVVKISDNFWNKLLPAQIEPLVQEISKKKFVREISISLQRDVLESPDPEKSKAMLGEIPSNMKVVEMESKILEIRPVRVGRNITYEYRAQFYFQLSLL